MRATMRNPSIAYGGSGLSRFLIGYLLMLLGTLMLVHVLQPQREGGSSMRQRQEPAPPRQVMLTPAGAPAVAPGRPPGAARPSRAPAQQAPAQ
jgi:hypothetical protein